MTQPLGIQVAGANSSARKVYRNKTYGAGTIAGFDFLNSSTYPAAVVPTAAIPGGTKLANLVEAPGGLAAPAIMGTASVLSAGGGIPAGAGKLITLPATCGLPAGAGADLHYLIILGMKPVAAVAVANESVAGWGTNTSTSLNWAIYRTPNNPPYFAGVGPAFGNFGSLTNAPHRLAIEVIKNGTAGTVSINLYVDGSLVSTGAAVALASIPQPIGAPMLGGAGFSASAGANEFNSVEIRNLALDTADVASIVAADFAAWGSRFN